MSKGKWNYLRDILIIIIVIIVLLIRIKIYFPFYLQETDNLPQDNTLLGEITQEHSFVQRLEFCQEKRLDKLSIFLATYARKNTCELNFKLYKNREEVYQFTIWDASALEDNTYFELNDIGLVCDAEDDVYLYITSPNAETGNAITVWMKAGQEGSEAYIYDGYKGASQPIGNTARFIMYQKSSLLEILNRSFSKVHYLPAVILGLLAWLVMVLLKELLPIEQQEEDIQ